MKHLIGEPNNVDNGEYCAEIKTGWYKPGWNDNNCTDWKSDYICKKTGG